MDTIGMSASLLRCSVDEGLRAPLAQARDAQAAAACKERLW
jgi:hypothetical protein